MESYHTRDSVMYPLRVMRQRAIYPSVLNGSCQVYSSYIFSRNSNIELMIGHFFQSIHLWRRSYVGLSYHSGLCSSSLGASVPSLSPPSWGACSGVSAVFFALPLIFFFLPVLGGSSDRRDS